MPTLKEIGAVLPKIHNINDPKYTLGYNDCTSQSGQIRISGNREKMAEIIYYARGYGSTKWKDQILPIKQLSYELADVLLAKLPEWIEVKKT